MVVAAGEGMAVGGILVVAGILAFSFGLQLWNYLTGSVSALTFEQSKQYQLQQQELSRQHAAAMSLNVMASDEARMAAWRASILYASDPAKARELHERIDRLRKIKNEQHPHTATREELAKEIQRLKDLIDKIFKITD